MGFARAQPILRAQPIQPRSSPGVVSWLARRTGRQTSGAARWPTGRRAIAGGDGATRITGGDGAPRIIGRRIGMAGAMMHGRGRCRDGGAENDCGGQRDCCPARHFRISGVSRRGWRPTGWRPRPRQDMGMGTDDAQRVRMGRARRSPSNSREQDVDFARAQSILPRFTGRVSRMRCSAKRCAADPGSLWTRGLLRSRVCSAPLRFASCCAAPGKPVFRPPSPRQNPSASVARIGRCEIRVLTPALTPDFVSLNPGYAC